MNPAALNAALNGDMRNAAIASLPGGIEALEAVGQIELCNSTKLPKDTNGCTREDLEKLGIKFLKSYDDIFINVKLPKDWKLIPTEHSMWNDLIDENKKVIAQVFYKAAFYDRSAHIQLVNH